MKLLHTQYSQEVSRSLHTDPVLDALEQVLWTRREIKTVKKGADLKLHPLTADDDQLNTCSTVQIRINKKSIMLTIIRSF